MTVDVILQARSHDRVIEEAECLPPIQSFWHGRPLGPIEFLTMHSFLQNGHPFHLYCFDNIQDVPRGVTLFDAAEILPQSTLFINNHQGFGFGSYAPFCNLFRAELLHQRGGWWVDMDVVCIKPLLFPQQNIIATSREWGWGDIANVNVLRFEAGHPICHLWRDRMRTEYKKELAHGRGPVAMQQVLKDNPEYASFTVPPEVFNPINWIHARYLVEREEPLWHRRTISRLLGRSPQIGRVTEQTHTVHLWHEMWRQQGYYPNTEYHPDTLYERLRRRYSVAAHQFAATG